MFLSKFSRHSFSFIFHHTKSYFSTVSSTTSSQYHWYKHAQKGEHTKTGKKLAIFVSRHLFNSFRLLVCLVADFCNIICVSAHIRDAIYYTTACMGLAVFGSASLMYIAAEQKEETLTKADSIPVPPSDGTTFSSISNSNIEQSGVNINAVPRWLVSLFQDNNFQFRDIKKERDLSGSLIFDR